MVQALRQRGMDVVRVQDRGRVQADDAEPLDEALYDERVMLTNDIDFLVLAARRVEQQQRFAPIFFWPQQRRSKGSALAAEQSHVVCARDRGTQDPLRISETPPTCHAGDILRRP